MERAPAFQFYPRDFVSDGRVEAMTTEEVGAYILLLCKAWFEEPIGTLPDDVPTLARWARVSPARWKKLAGKVLSPFAIGDDGRWHQKRMQEVAAEQEEYRRKLEARARKGADARWGEDAKAMPKHSPSSDKHMLNDAPSSASASAPASAMEKTDECMNGANVASLDVENFVDLAIRTANGGMIAAEIDFKSILGSHPSRQNVFDWLEAGIDRETILETVHATAKSAGKQISSMKYFDKRIRDAHEKKRAAIHPDSQAGAVKAAGPAAEKPQRNTKSSGQLRQAGTDEPVLSEEEKIRAEQKRVDTWRFDHGEQAQAIWDACVEEATKNGIGAMGEFHFKKYIESRFRRRVVDEILTPKAVA